jgi:rhodanese-related sulfurtransferase
MDYLFLGGTQKMFKIFKFGKKTQKEDLKNITPEKAFSLVNDNKNNSNFVILDVRTPIEYRDGHVEGSKNIDYKSNDFKKVIEEMDKTKTYILYCRSGVRSAKSYDIMKKLNFTDVYNVEGGIKGWMKKGLPIVK